MADLSPAPAAVERTAGLAGPDAAVLDVRALAGGSFLESYRRASSALPDPLYWDLWAAARSHDDVESWVPNFRDLGRPDLTAPELRSRHSAWTRQLIRALG